VNRVEIGVNGGHGSILASGIAEWVKRHAKYL
jgi:hypothetical protein